MTGREAWSSPSGRGAGPIRTWQFDRRIGERVPPVLPFPALRLAE